MPEIKHTSPLSPAMCIAAFEASAAPAPPSRPLPPPPPLPKKHSRSGGDARLAHKLLNQFTAAQVAALPDNKAGRGLTPAGPDGARTLAGGAQSKVDVNLDVAGRIDNLVKAGIPLDRATSTANEMVGTSKAADSAAAAEAAEATDTNTGNITQHLLKIGVPAHLASELAGTLNGASKASDTAAASAPPPATTAQSTADTDSIAQHLLKIGVPAHLASDLADTLNGASKAADPAATAPATDEQKKISEMKAKQSSNAILAAMEMSAEIGKRAHKAALSAI